MTTEPLGARVARRLRDARIHAGMTVREAAAELAISHTLIVKYENGVVAPSFERLQSLAAIYRTSAAALLAERDEAIPLLAVLDQATEEEIAHFIQLMKHAHED
jgi:transcriptional regulator with XRE-family HTH domain